MASPGKKGPAGSSVRRKPPAARQDQLSQVSGCFAAHQEQAFLLKVVVTFIAVYWLVEHTNVYLWRLFALMVIILTPAFIVASSMWNRESLVDTVRKHVTFIPTVHLEERSRDDRLAWVTYALIALNVLIHYGFTESPLLNVEEIIDHLVFIPVAPNMWNTPVSLFTSMFLHGNSAHLWGNMFFLWGIGGAVERRVGTVDYIAIYLITGIISGGTQAILFLALRGQVTHALGASGAIAGVMGVFMVRCYFKKLTYPFPGFLPVNLKVRINSVALFGIFFFMDLSGGIDQMRGGLSRIGHWAHLGGMIAGFAIAAVRGLAGEGVTERNLEVGLDSLDEGIGLGEGEQALRAALKSDPESLEAMLSLARIKSKFRYSQTEEARQLYEKVIAGLVSRDAEAAAEIYEEYRGKYEKGLAPQLQYRMAGILYRNGKSDSAARSYEELAGREDAIPETREKALYRCGRILDEMGLGEGAEMFYAQFLEKFPESAMAEKVRKRAGMEGT